MALTKNKKKEILDKVTDVASKAKSVVFVNFHGLNVKDSTEMRRDLRKAGVRYTVAKKTLASKAFTAQKIGGALPELEGELALVYPELGGAGDDITAPAREVFVFQKKHEGKVSILGGVFENTFKGKDEMVAIAAIPSRQTLLGMFVNLVNSPIQRFVIAMNEIAKTKSA